MKTTYPNEGDQIVHTLNQLGVRLLNTTGSSERLADLPALSSVQLITKLSMQSDARVRSMLIALLLMHPDLMDVVPAVDRALLGRAALNLKFFYTASVYLQPIYRPQLVLFLGQQHSLIDLFGEELAVSKEGMPERRIMQLGKRHSQLSGIQANWAGTYHHSAKLLLKRLACEERWGLQ